MLKLNQQDSKLQQQSCVFINVIKIKLRRGYENRRYHITSRSPQVAEMDKNSCYYDCSA